MSVYYFLLCPETKKYVWLGRNTRSIHEPSGAEEMITIYVCEPVAPFLDEHIGKAIIPLSEFHMEDYGPEYKEVTWQDYAPKPEKELVSE